MSMPFPSIGQNTRTPPPSLWPGGLHQQVHGHPPATNGMEDTATEQILNSPTEKMSMPIAVYAAAPSAAYPPSTYANSLLNQENNYPPTIASSRHTASKEPGAKTADKPVGNGAGQGPGDPEKEKEIIEVVETLRNGRIASCQAAAVAAALFAGIEATVISVVKQAQPTKANPGASKLMLFLSYAAIILNASTTFTSLLLIDKLGGIPFETYKSPPRKEILLTDNLRVLTGRKALALYGAGGRTWQFIEWHYFATLISGGFCIFFQILVYIWLNESYAVKIASSCGTFLAILPFFAMFFW